jgi:hypothetical protein
MMASPKCRAATLQPVRGMLDITGMQPQEHLLRGISAFAMRLRLTFRNLGLAIFSVAEKIL